MKSIFFNNKYVTTKLVSCYFKDRLRRTGSLVMRGATRGIQGDFQKHSPMWKNRHNVDERRSNLFHDKPFVYGRLPKLVLAYGLATVLWFSYYTRMRYVQQQ